ncbi:acid phosphatase/Vanadium-dependent haloperoxidase [Linnemannia elongata AG-77]|uniref:Acid phosphatase/Vanadium-dependent haloperoxidase n=1 Tax=Linnemannia elongata AG-77 TaxID=1314771 RepID=A0A197JJZ6_9FUNG|nr:acid phosphatase/Vanadium-dependent haloperoxidase [Linnemannia elongata AG-77]
MTFTLFSKTRRMQARTKALFWSYGRDWALVIIVLAAFTYIDSLEPYHRQFSVKDVTIQHPFAKKETVPIWMAFVLAFIVPGIIIGCIAIFHRKSYTDLHNGLLGLFLAQALVLIVTDSIKITVGRPRPDFLDRCFEIYDKAAAGTPIGIMSDPDNMLSSSSLCTRTDLLKDGFKSFPSGHSSFSFGGLGYLSLYLAGKLHLFDERGHIYKSIVVLAPLILAALIAISRVDNYRHHWQDVTVGSIIGAVFAVFAYRQYYPSLGAKKSAHPFAPRSVDHLLPTSLLPGGRHEEHTAQQQAFLDDAGLGPLVGTNLDTIHVTSNGDNNNNNGQTGNDPSKAYGNHPNSTFNQPR